MLVHRYAVIKELRRQGATQRSLAAEQRTSWFVPAEARLQQSNTDSTSAPTGNLRLRSETTVVSFSEATP